jgi:hypothetical protein
MSKNLLIGDAVTSEGKVQDLILWEAEQRYCRTAVDLSEGEYVVGEILTNESPATASAAAGLQASFSDVLCLENVTVGAGVTKEVAVLCRGPALVNLDAVLRTTDESDTDLKTRLADLVTQGVRFVREPAVQSDVDLAG